MNPNLSNLIWIDLEMTGLEPKLDRIIEIATVITDTHLNVIAEGPQFTIWQSDERLNNMDAWNTKHHRQSGLTLRVQASQTNEATAEKETIEFLNKHVPHGTSPMCGNSICQDRRFLCEYMPELASFFHYRNLDVTTVKMLAQRWAPGIPELKKQMEHRALADIHDSILELKHYRENFLKTNNNL